MPRSLLEREGELAQLAALLSQVKACEGDLLLISGVAGMGKSELLRGAIENAAEQGIRSLFACGSELEGGFGFGLVRQLFEPVIAGATEDERERLLAGPARHALLALESGPGDEGVGSSSAGSFAVLHGLYWLTVNLSATQPLLLAVDDLHWADAPSLRFLLYLVPRLPGLPIGLLMAARTGEPSVADELLDRLRGLVADRSVHPRPLSPEGAATLIGEMLGEVEPGLLAACQEATRGNPFLVRELASALKADAVSGELAATRVLELGPRSVGRSVALRLARLGPAAGAVITALAVLGDGADIDHLAELAGVSLDKAAEALDRLAAAGIVEPGLPARFVHSVVRSAVYDDIPVALRSLRHAAAAQLLAERGADEDRICAHLVRCPPSGSDEVVQHLRAGAAGALARGAPDSATAYLERAVRERSRGAERANLLRELGSAERLLRSPGAESHLKQALALAREPQEKAEIAFELTELLAFAGRWNDALAVAESTMAELNGGTGRSHAASLQFTATDPLERLRRLWAWLAAYDPRRVDDYDLRLRDMSESVLAGEHADSTMVAMVAVTLAWRCERMDDVERLVDELFRNERPAPGVASNPLLLMRMANAAMLLDKLSALDDLSSDMLATSARDGAVLEAAMALTYRVAVRARRGDLPGAESDFRSVLEMGQLYDLGFAFPSLIWMGVDVLLERPELTDITGLVETIDLEGGLAETAIGAIWKEVRGNLALARRDLALAASELEQAARIYQSTRALNPNGSCWRSALAASLGSEQRERARELVMSELGAAESLGHPRPIGIARRTLGLIEGGDDGIAHLREAVNVLQSSDARLELARTLVALGAALRRSNQRVASREPLSAGLDLAEECGAIRLAGQARDELRAAGARPRRSRTSGAEALTPAERRVAELAGGGLSNPEIAQALFVTINTVEGHLRHVFRKLNIASRRQISAALSAVLTEEAAGA